jgi:hypothetical protein
MIRNGSYLSKENLAMTITDTTNAIERIEFAEREMPFCDCGQPMTPVGREDGIWLECISRTQPTGSPLGRLISTLSNTGHGRRLIIEADIAA